MNTADQIIATSTPAVSTAPAQYTTPSLESPPTITADGITTPAQPLTMPGTSPATPPDYYQNLIKSVPTIESIVAQKTPEQIAATVTRDKVSTQMLDVLSKVSGKTMAQQRAEEAAGLPDLEKQFSDVNAQIKALQNESLAIPLQVQNDSEGRGRTTAGVAPIQSALLRTNAIKSLGLSSIAAALQGNIGLARQQADRAIAAEFDPLQSQLDYLKTVYSINKDILSDVDKKQADRINAMLTERQAGIDSAKADRTKVLDMVGDALKLGAPASIGSGALSMTLPEATRALAPYLKTKTDWSEPYTLGGDVVQKNLSTGEIRTAVNVSKTSGGGTFTQTQINQGAANAGLPIAQFAALDANTQNWFINGYSTFQTLKKKVDSGELTKEQLAEDITSSISIPDTVKPLLLNVLGVRSASASSGKTSGGFWNGVGSLLGGAASFAGKFLGI